MYRAVTRGSPQVGPDEGRDAVEHGAAMAQTGEQLGRAVRPSSQHRASVPQPQVQGRPAQQGLHRARREHVVGELRVAPHPVAPVEVLALELDVVDAERGAEPAEHPLGDELELGQGAGISRRRRRSGGSWCCGGPCCRCECLVAVVERHQVTVAVRPSGCSGAGRLSPWPNGVPSNREAQRSSCARSGPALRGGEALSSSRRFSAAASDRTPTSTTTTRPSANSSDRTAPQKVRRSPPSAIRPSRGRCRENAKR